jgi:hypothetical protein
MRPVFQNAAERHLPEEIREIVSGIAARFARYFRRPMRPGDGQPAANQKCPGWEEKIL